MKIGEGVPVYLSNHEVAQAYVEDIDGDTVTLVIPATRVQMGIKSELTDLPTTEPEKETVLLGPQDNSPVEPSQAQEAVVEPEKETQQALAETGGRSLKEVELDSTVLDD